jgi:hypothetical protein
MATGSRIRSLLASALLPSLAVLPATVGCSSDGGTPALSQSTNPRGGGSSMGGGSTLASGGTSAKDGKGGTSAAVGTNSAAGGSSNTSSSSAPEGGGGVSSSSVPKGSGGSSVSLSSVPKGSGGSSVSSGGAVQAGAGRSAAGGRSSMGAAGKATGGGTSLGTAGKATGGGTSLGTAGQGTGGGTAPTTGAAGATNSSSGDAYNPKFVEFYGEDCNVADPKDASVSTLPDLFATPDGSRMSKKSDWRCQRAYLKKVVEKYIHGEKPGKPDTVTGSVTSSAIKVHVEHKGKSIDFSVSVTMPGSASGPVPAIIGVGGSSLDSSIVKGEGVAQLTYDHQKISSETDRSGLFSNIYGSTGASAQIGWAWGVSRIIDVLVAERDAGRNDIIDPTAIGVTGCSRNGKGAFTVGAFDERIALGIPQESGTGGVSALRIVATSPTGPNGKPAQSIDSALSEAAGWFGTAISTYKSKLNTVPGDTHSLVAMYAPRGLLVLDNSRIGELCATCQHAASAAGAILYSALGLEKNIEYNGGNPSDPHNHCTFYPDTQGEPLKRAIRAFLTKKATPDGRIAPQPAGTADLTKWITWTAPALADDVSWASPPLTSK